MAKRRNPAAPIAACVILALVALLVASCRPAPAAAARTYRLVPMDPAELPYGNPWTIGGGPSPRGSAEETYRAYIMEGNRNVEVVCVSYSPESSKAFVYPPGKTWPSPVSCARPEEAVEIYLAGKLPVVTQATPAGPSGSTIDYERLNAGTQPDGHSVNSGTIGTTK